MEARHRDARGWSLVAFALATLGSAALLFVPVFVTGPGGSVTEGGPHGTTPTEHQTLLQADGWWGALILLAPILLAAVPVLLRNQRHVRAWRAGVVLLLLPILPYDYFVAGGFYVPTFVAMAIAASRRD